MFDTFLPWFLLLGIPAALLLLWSWIRVRLARRTGMVSAAVNEYLAGLDRGEVKALWRTRIKEKFVLVASELQSYFEDEDWIDKADLMSAHLSGPSTEHHTPSHVALPTSPQRIGRFEITGILFSNQKVIVYSAVDPAVSRPVALKVFWRACDATELELARFRNEGCLVAQLSHPHIVTVFEADASRELNGSPYLCMEYMAGGHLGQLIKQPWDPTRAATLVCTLAKATAYAHLKGIIHRDLKPSNVLCTDSGTPKVADFGLAKQLPTGFAATVSYNPTPDRALLGTPEYMAPEQTIGKADERSDIYSLGAILYCLLTTRPPFLAPTLKETLWKVATEDCKPPPGPAALRTICMKCLEKDPARRYLNAKDLAKDLERFATGLPITAHPPGPFQLLRNWGRRHPKVRAAVLVALTVLLTALVGERVLTAIQLNDWVKGRVEAIKVASLLNVPAIVDDIRPYPRLAREYLGLAWQRAREHDHRHLSIPVALLLLGEHDVVPDVCAHLGRAELGPSETTLVASALLPLQTHACPLLWKDVENVNTSRTQRFRAACILAHLDPLNPKWVPVSTRTMEELVATDSLTLGEWVKAFRGARVFLREPLFVIARSAVEPQKRLIAAIILRTFADDEPRRITSLLVESDVPQFLALFPILQQHPTVALPLFRDELKRDMPETEEWADKGDVKGKWKAIDSRLAKAFAESKGILEERFAFCQQMKWKQFLALEEPLRKAAYRPLRVRPYNDGSHLLVAAVFVRDEQDWILEHGKTAAGLQQQGAAWQSKGYFPVDVASYRLEGANTEAFGGVWSRAANLGSKKEIVVNMTEAELRALPSKIRESNLLIVTLQTSRTSAGQSLYNVVLAREPEDPIQANARFDLDEPTYAKALSTKSLQLDVSLSGDVKSSRYCGVWHARSGFLAAELHGLEHDEHLKRSKTMAAKGYRPIAIGALADEDGKHSVASVWHRPALGAKAKDDWARRKANAAVGLLHLGNPELVWPLLRDGKTPGVRAHVINRIGPLAVDHKSVTARLVQEQDATARSGLVLSLGEFSDKVLGDSEREKLLPTLLKLFKEDPDAGVHSAVEWLLRLWNYQPQVVAAKRELARTGMSKKLGWYVSPEQDTFAVFRGPTQFLMGSPDNEPHRIPGETLHLKGIARSFALCTTEVTVEQFLRLDKDFHFIRFYSPEPDCPIAGVSWYYAAAHCRKRSELEGIPKEQMCYPDVPTIMKAMRQGLALELPSDYLKRTGYRLPTEAEWECAFRAGTAGSSFLGFSTELWPRYAWGIVNSDERSWPVGTLKPNGFGMFDGFGNVMEWCQDEALSYPTSRTKVSWDEPASTPVDPNKLRSLRGGSFDYRAYSFRSAFRFSRLPGQALIGTGFRLARTIPDEKKD